MSTPFPATIQDGATNISGFVMKLTINGFLFELDQIPFRAGAMLFVTFQVPNSEVIVAEKVRSIKHYDRYFRQPPKKKPKTSEEIVADENKPKKLVEFHFVQLKPENLTALQKYLLQLSVEAMRQTKR